MSAIAWTFLLAAYTAIAAIHRDVQGLMPVCGGVLSAGLVEAFFSREV